MEIFDQHTHHLNAPLGHALINIPMKVFLSPDEFAWIPGQFYSAGIFPLFEGDWSTAFSVLSHWAVSERLTAIGECGFDKRSTVAPEIQRDYFTRQMRLADSLKLPLIIHCVHAWDQLIQVNRLYQARAPRIVHGFRGKPELARQLLSAGFYLSFGSRFHEESLKLCPPNRFLSETDNSTEPIAKIIEKQCSLRTSVWQSKKE